MSVKFPITLTGKSGSAFSFLLDGMEEWWEDADDVSKHTNTQVLNTIAANSSITSAPNGFDAWSRTTASANYGGSTDRTNDFTFAFVVNKWSSGNYVEILKNGMQLQYRTSNVMWCDNLPYDGGTNRFSATNIVRGQWQSVVLTKVSGRVYLYVDGVSAKPGGHLYNLTGQAWFDISSDTAHAMAVVARWGRGFTQTYVDAFHNGGAFLTYSML